MVTETGQKDIQVDNKTTSFVVVEQHLLSQSLLVDINFDKCLCSKPQCILGKFINLHDIKLCGDKKTLLPGLSPLIIFLLQF